METQNTSAASPQKDTRLPNKEMWRSVRGWGQRLRDGKWHLEIKYIIVQIIGEQSRFISQVLGSKQSHCLWLFGGHETNFFVGELEHCSGMSRWRCPASSLKDVGVKVQCINSDLCTPGLNMSG